MTTPSDISITTPASGIDHALLTQLGLEQSDVVRIQEVSESLKPLAPAELHQFGKDVSTKTADFSSKLLDHVRNRDLDTTGEQLTDVVRIARTLNFEQLGSRSKIPLLGGLIDRMRDVKGELVQKFSSTNQQIEQLMRDITKQQTGLQQRIKDFDKMHDVVVDERKELGIHIAAGKLRLSQLEQEYQALGDQDDPQTRQQKGAIDNAIRILDKRVGDLVMLQHSADQAMPMIRMIQTNAMLLVEKFTAVRDITLPAWKRNFAIQLSLNEQQNAVKLANAIDDATNDMMKRNADLLHQNSVETAKANQRAVIDLETLKHVHDQLIRTVEEVRTIHQEGMQKRQQAEHDLAQLREQMQKQLAAPTVG